MSLDHHKLQAKAERLVAQGKLSQAVDEYRGLLKAHPSDLPTLNRAGDLLVQAGRDREAIEMFTRAGHLYTEGGFFLKAIAIYKKVLKLDPSGIDARIRLGDLYARGDFTSNARGEYVAAMTQLVKQGEEARARELLVKLTRVEPGSLESRMALAEVYLARGEDAKGLAELREAAQELGRLASHNLCAGVHERILGVESVPLESAFGSIRALIALRSFDAAVGAARRIRQKFPAEAAAAEALVEALDAAGKGGEAEEVADRDLGGGAASPAVRLVLGRVRAAQGRLPEAVETIRAAAQELRGQGRFHEAARALDHLLELVPDDVETIEERIEIAQALGALEEVSRLSMRRDQLLGRIRATPGVPAGSDVPAELRGETAAASRTASGPEGSEFLTEKTAEAEVFFRYGLHGKAEETLRAILDRFPDHLDAHLRLRAVYAEQGDRAKLLGATIALAGLHEQLGRRDDAIGALLEAIALDAEAPGLRDRLRHLGVRDTEASPAEPTAARDDLLDLDGEIGRGLARVLALESVPPPAPAEEPRLEDSIRAFRERVQEVVGEGDSRTHYEIAIGYKEMGLMEEALEEFEVAARDPRRLVESASMLAMCLRELGRAGEAADWCRRALASDGIGEEAQLGLLYDLAEAHLDLGERDEARGILARIASRNPAYRDVTARLDALQRDTR